MLTSPLPSRNMANASATTITFRGARVARSAYNARYRTISVRGERLDQVYMTGAASPVPETIDGISIDLSGYLVLPGLINAHDHLDFSTFPRLGRGIHSNWKKWCAEIHRSERQVIDECLRVPKDVRLWWGGIRNLLCGVTTVSHHNPYTAGTFDADFPINVLREYGWAHSLADVHRVSERFGQTPTEWPFLLHLAEGTDDDSQHEFDALDRLLRVDSQVVMVHCLGLTPEQWERAALAGAGVVWCPSSNLYTLGTTLNCERIMSFPNLALGSDSPLTATGDLLDEIRLAHHEIGIPAPIVYELVTSRPARLLRLGSGEGTLQPGNQADLIVTRDRDFTPAHALVQLTWRDIEFVMQRGRIVLVSAELADRIPDELTRGMEPVSIDGHKRFVRAPIAELWTETFTALGRIPALSGRMLSIESGDRSCSAA